MGPAHLPASRALSSALLLTVNRCARPHTLQRSWRLPEPVLVATRMLQRTISSLSFALFQFPLYSLLKSSKVTIVSPINPVGDTECGCFD